MEAERKSSLHKLPPLINAQQASLTVNPKYQLPSSLPPPQNMDRLPLPEAGQGAQGNGVSRRTSRRRRAAGKDQLERSPQATSSEVPKAPPAHYLDRSGSGATISLTSSNSTSFAARVRAAPAHLISTQIPDDDFDPLIQSSIAKRYGSLNRPPGALYAEVQSSNRASFPSPTTGVSSPPYSPHAATPKQLQADKKSSLQTSSGAPTSKGHEDAVHSVSRSTSRRVSAGVVDRSPLQDLEVKLNDISKGEKRARVEEAEQLLKDAKSGIGTRKSSQEIDTKSDNRQTRRSSAGPDGKSRSVALDESRQLQDQAILRRGQDFSRTRIQLESTKATSLLPSEKQRRTSNNELNSPISSIKDPTASRLPLYRDRTRKPSKVTVELSDSGQQPARGVHFQYPSSPEELDPDLVVSGQQSRRKKTEESGSVSFPGGAFTVSTPDRSYQAMGIKVSKKTDGQQQLQQHSGHHEKTASSNNKSFPLADQAPVNSKSNHIQHRGNDALNHKNPPQSVDGIEPPKNVGIGNNPKGVSDEPVHSKPHLSNIIHRRRHRDSALESGFASRSSRLDERRQSSTARLTAAVVNLRNDSATEQSAWWESAGSNGVNSIARAGFRNRRDVRSLDAGYDEIYGKASFSPLAQDRTMDLAQQNSYSVTAAHKRRYVANDGLQVGEGRDQYWRRGHALLYGREKQQLSLSTAYSYSCPHLDEHDGSHIYHICKPYMSKELIRSMRAIRIRAAPPAASFNPPLYLKCGPLLRYTGLKREIPPAADGSYSVSTADRETWRGSVMIVTVDADSSYNPIPVLRLFPEPIDTLTPPKQQADESGHSLPSEYIDPIAGLPKISRTGKTVYVKPVEDLEEQVDLSRVEDDGGLFEETRTAAVPTSYGQPSSLPIRNLPSTSNSKMARRPERDNLVRYQKTKGVRLHAERGITFWRFSLEIELTERQVRIAYRINNGASVGFWVPARGQTMNVMFHSCNGFSMSINPDHFSGPDPLWRDVLNRHQTRPFHVMIGGGDQIYNDAVMSQTKLFREWLGKNPLRKHEAQFTAQMQEELETFYLERYSMWFSQGLFGMANSQIPMVNMWDDHDIIDGFGSYPDYFMRSPVFCGVGTVAFKYYMLFQHQSVIDEGPGDEPSWLLGAAPGPYIKEHSRSIFMFLGKHVAFLGLDCRTERMRDEILSEESYNLAFDRCRREIIKGETKHLIVLLGVPIAYPRLVWLENLLTSKVMDPIKALGRAGLLGSFLNKFDGGVEILDDLDDHWTSKNHKAERNWFIQELQEIAAEKSVRVTILGRVVANERCLRLSLTDCQYSGDVHMAAVGQFFSNPKLKIPKDQDHRYMANVISSAIVNAPPPEMMGDILNKRNKLHHLDHETDENMIPIFTHDVDGKPRSNKHLLPRRNWCSIREYHPEFPGTTPPSTAPSSEPQTPNHVPARPANRLQRTLSLTRNDAKPANLLRRLSQRGPPPSLKYPLSTEYRLSPPADVSPAFRPLESVDYFSSRDRPIAQEADGKSTSLLRHSSAPVSRPGNFHRRPTNTNKRAASKGGSDETDGHINLQHGLDIVLNCEASQRDPAGITNPYRLLIPTLWYEGNGDQNEAPYRKKSWISKFGSISKGSRKKSDLAGWQDGGVWGGSYSGDSEIQSDSEGEEEPMRSSEVRHAKRIGAFGIADNNVGVLAKGGRSQSERYPVKKDEFGSTHGNSSLGDTHTATSKVDDMLGLASPVQARGRGNDVRLVNNKMITIDKDDGNRNGSTANPRRAAFRFEKDGERNAGDEDELARRTTGRGYDGIDAYKESRWRRFF